MSGALPVSLRTEVCDLLGCEYPVVLAGMGGCPLRACARRHASTRLRLSRRGAGATDLIRREVEAMRRGTLRPFGVNIIPAATPSDLLEA